MLQQDLVLVAHNASFDMRFLLEWIEICGQQKFKRNYNTNILLNYKRSYWESINSFFSYLHTQEKLKLLSLENRAFNLKKINESALSDRYSNWRRSFRENIRVLSFSFFFILYLKSF